MRLFARLKAFHRDRRGVSALFITILMIPLIGVIGIAFDGARLFMVQSRLKSAVDAAGLVAARDINDSNRNTNATNLFWANFQRASAGSTKGFLGTTISSVAISQVSSTVAQVTATGTMPTTFMNILGISTMNVTSSTQSTRAIYGLEITLALDNTGSMAGWPIQSVISASQNLVNIVYGSSNADTQPNLWMGVVPFSAEVNIGNSHTSWLKAGSNTTSSYMNGSWSGCVMARYDTTDPITGLTNDFTDVPPALAPFTPFLYPSTSGVYTAKNSSGKTVAVTGDNDWTPSNITESKQATITSNTAVGPNLGCPQTSGGKPLPLLPLTASKSTVLSTINAMTANYRGGTFINLGLQAGWWTLSPKWRGIAGWGDATLPLDYLVPNFKKIIVLMTDGNNTWYDWPGGAPGAGPSPWTNDGNTDFTAYGRLLDNDMKLPAGQNNQNNATANINAKMSQVCTLIKSTGIIIYTILFNHDGSISSDTQTLFQNCASSPQNYFLDATDAQLQATFSAIGNQVSALRVSK